MEDYSQEIIGLLERYGSDYKQILREYSKLEYLYVFSDIREQLLEWYSFRREGRLLQVGADYGALTGLFLRNNKRVVVLDDSEKQTQVCRRRYQEAANLECIQAPMLTVIPDVLREQKFDTIVMIGSLGEYAESQIKNARKILDPEGELIIAVCNPLGIKYLAGAKADPFSFTRNQMLTLLGDEGQLKWYYPMPDYRMPLSLYSQDYLPKKGDLTKPLAAYDYPRYVRLDMGAMFDAVCEDGRFEEFANSFLTIWSGGKEKDSFVSGLGEVPRDR